MAANDRPARLALAVAVVVLLLGAAGVLLRQPGTAGATGTIRTDDGIEVVAPAGTRVSTRPAPAPDPRAVPAVARLTGGGVDLTFEGGPVRVWIPVPAAPSPGFAPVLVTAGGTRLVPAGYDAATRRVFADLARPGGVWGGLLDLAAVARGAATAPGPRPDCAGRAASSAGVTVAVGAPDPRAPVWACVTAGSGRASVTLTSNARVPYRISLPPDWPEPSARTAAASTSAVQLLGGPRQRDLLWPGAGVTYDVPFARLPASLRGQADPGPALGTLLAGTAHRVAALSGLTDAPEPAPAVLTCAADAGAARYTPDRPLAEVAADVWAALEPCHPDGGDVVRRLVTTGIGPVASGFAEALAGPAFEVPVTTSRAQRFTQDVAYQPWNGTRVAANLSTTTVTGACGTVSAVSGRHDAYRCSGGGTTYDPCFAAPAPRPQVVCPASAAKAVLLTYSGALPSPPGPGGTAAPFLLTLEDGRQCAAVAGGNAGYTCADGRTLHGVPDPSGPLWTIEALGIAKAYF